jgi:acid phosphatase
LLAQVGYHELNNLGVQTRLRYPTLYSPNELFTVWADSVQRAVDSAITYSHAFGGPNATRIGTVVNINASSPDSGGNSLATSDNCPLYDDNSGAPENAIFEALFVPSIQTRLSQFIIGNFSFSESEILLIPVLCGFETMITGTSHFCDILTDDEIRNYEYTQDLRYWYGTGMLPLIIVLMKKKESDLAFRRP